MATRTVTNRKPKSQDGTTFNEFTDHFVDILNAIRLGEVQGIAMAVVTADSPNSHEFGAKSSTLTRDSIAALILRDTTSDLWEECEEQVHDELIAPCLKKSAATGTVK